VRVTGAHDVHVKLVWKRKVCDEAPPTGKKRRIFEPCDGTANQARMHVSRYLADEATAES
jgi:hypothetical protein